MVARSPIGRWSPPSAPPHSRQKSLSTPWRTVWTTVEWRGAAVDSVWRAQGGIRNNPSPPTTSAILAHSPLAAQPPGLGIPLVCGQVWRCGQRSEKRYCRVSPRLQTPMLPWSVAWTSSTIVHTCPHSPRGFRLSTYPQLYCNSHSLSFFTKRNTEAWRTVEHPSAGKPDWYVPRCIGIQTSLIYTGLYLYRARYQLTQGQSAKSPSRPRGRLGVHQGSVRRMATPSPRGVDSPARLCAARGPSR